MVFFMQKKQITIEVSFNKVGSIIIEMEIQIISKHTDIRYLTVDSLVNEMKSESWIAENVLICVKCEIKLLIIRKH